MPNQDHKTKDFLKKIEQLIERGIVKNHAEVVATLNWNKSVMSSVKNGQLPVPQHIYNKFRDTYSEQLQQLEPTKNPDQLDQDYQAKYVRLLEKQAEEKDRLIKSLEDRLTVIDKALGEIKQNQYTMYAIQLGYQESTLPVLGSLGQKKAIRKEAGEKAVAYLQRFQKEGIAIVT